MPTDGVTAKAAQPNRRGLRGQTRSKIKWSDMGGGEEGCCQMFSLADELVGERLATRLTLLAPTCTMSAHHI